MGAIIKTIAIHSDSVNPLLKYCHNSDKTSISKNLQRGPEWSINNALNYAANPLKTLCSVDENHKELLISGVKCNPNTAAQEFDMVRQKYRQLTGNREKFEPFEYTDRRTKKVKTVQRAPVTAIHMIQSFSEEDLDPHLVHQIGIELLERLGLQGVVDTHLNKEHLHNHIIINTYMDNGKKWNCNIDERLRVRELSDEIQKEYGIEIQFDNPREQQAISKGIKRSYKEWMATDDGTSWKDQMKKDIAAVTSVTHSKDDYLSMMEAYGYKVVNETKSAVTFQLEDGTLINDTTLGNNYSTSFLFPGGEKRQVEYHIKPYKVDTISIAKYNADGTPRGILELLVRRAIAIIQRLKAFVDNIDNVYTTYTAEEKLKMLNEAKDVIIKHNITNKEQLNEALSKTGAKLSQIKSKKRELDSEKSLYDTLQSAIDEINSLRTIETQIGNLQLHLFTDEEIRKNRAHVSPAPASKKSALAIALNDNPDYKLVCTYNELTNEEAIKVIDYLNQKTSEKPDILVTEQEFEKVKALRLSKKIYETKVRNIADNLNKPASPNAIAQANTILKQNGQSEISDATIADIIDIRNCYSKNPFGTGIISEEQQSKLTALLQEKGLSTYRPVSDITEEECIKILSYIKRPNTKMPNILKPYEAPTEREIDTVKAILDAKSISITVDIQKLSKSDIEELLTHAVYVSEKPIIIDGKQSTITNNDRDNLFIERIGGYKIDKMVYLTKYRDALNTLRSLGYNVNQSTNLYEIQAQIDEWMKNYDAVSTEKDELSQLYHDLLKTKNTIRKAETREFIYGKAPEKQIEIEVKEKEERDEKEKPNKSQERER